MMWKTFLQQQLTIFDGAGTLQAIPNYLPYILGLGIISVSHSTLALLRGKKHLALPVTLLSTLFAYSAEAYLGGNYFLVLFGSALALSVLAGFYTREGGDGSA